MWQKEGLVFSSEGQFGWNKSHAHVICTDSEFEEKIRLIYSARDEKGRCIPAYLDVLKSEPNKILNINQNPILELGARGMFDDCGIMPTWLLHHPNGERWLYYIGWTVRNTVPYHNALGIAISTDNGQTYKKLFDGPVISTIHNEPQFSGSCCVLFDNGIFKMWYLNCTHWEELNGKIEPIYHIKYAESNDGISWNRNNTVAIDFKTDEEGGISRPCVIKEKDGTYSMWYSYRDKTLYRGENLDKSYRIGYATSKNGVQWERKDDTVGIDISENGWDSEMIEYPMVFDNLDYRYLIYNGNGFGKSGFGLAKKIG